MKNSDMFILHELYNRKNSHYTACTLGEHSSQMINEVGTFRKMLHHAQQSQESKKLLLLDEQRFSWFATPIAFCAIKPCTVQDMYAVIEPIMQKHSGHQSEKLFYHIDAITVNGKVEDYYIGKQGDIRCVMHIAALHRDDWYMAKSVLGTMIDTVSIYPASFFTLHHIKQTLNKKSGTLLYIGQYHTKRITFVQGIYQTCEVLELGWQVLKDIYAENNIHDFFDADKDMLEANQYAKNLVEQSVKFYVDMLLRWLRACNTQGDMFLISDIVQNEYFMDIFAHDYQQHTSGFVLPLAHVKGLKTYGRKRGQKDLDIQTAAHYYV